MLEDYKVRFDDVTFDCVDFGFKKDEPVDVVLRPEDIDIVDVKDGKLTGEVQSVLFKGVHYEIIVETVPGTSVTVNMRVVHNRDVTSEDGTEKISASDFYVDVEDVEALDDKEIIAFSNAQAWDPKTDEYISIARIEYDLKPEEGEYPVTFSTSKGTSVQRNIFVVNQPFVKNERANEGVMAFNFSKTVDEIIESQALDTDLKTWANAQGGSFPCISEMKCGHSDYREPVCVPEISSDCKRHSYVPDKRAARCSQDQTIQSEFRSERKSLSLVREVPFHYIPSSSVKISLFHIIL